MFDALATDEDEHEEQVHGYYSSEDDSNPITHDLGVVREVALDPPRSVQEILSQASDAWALSYDERKVLYDYLERQASVEAEDEMEHLAQQYQFNHDQYKEAKDRLELETLMSATVIGMTTTKASKLQHVLQQLCVKVVVIEEAAEVLEAHVLSCLSEEIEHLILIGDHLQLRPKVETYKLTAASRQGYNLDISLFERLALGRDLPIVQLTQQRRMRPDFADLIRLQVYPSLQDHPSCDQHPDVPGMRSNLWFFDHEVMEDAVKEGVLEDGVSKSNRHEVALVVGLTSYLLKQGYGPGQITVLTPYLKQLFDLRAALSTITMTFTDERDELALDVLGAAEDDMGTEEAGGQQYQQAMTRTTAKDRVRMATIDNFQGEESEIVIISLVRSNPDGSIGFLRMANWVNVLLSRAKDGMYLLGNADTLTANPKNNIWPAVIELLKERGKFGRSFPLICGRHPEYQVDVSSASDFELLVQNGGCTRPCAERLPCGHSCTLMCHPKWNSEHLDVVCTFPCAKTCARGHACPLTCSEPCRPCERRVPLLQPLPCGHQPNTIPCHLYNTLERVYCEVGVTVKAEGCDHEARVMACSESRKESATVCRKVCGARLQCGHMCPEVCGACVAHNRVVRERGGGVGGWRPVRCDQACGVSLLCGHTCALPCCHATLSVPMLCDCRRPCDVACSHSRCAKTCGEVCVPCAMECDWECRHQGPCSMPCGAPCDRAPCDMPFARTLECGHPCPSVCGERCPPPAYCPSCATDDVKGRIVDLVMLTTYAEHDFREEPVLVLECGHVYTVSTLDGHVHLDEFYTDGGVGTTRRPAQLDNALVKPPVCPECRGFLASIRRYGRPIKKALLDNAQKKFIEVSNARLQSEMKALELMREMKLPLGTSTLEKLGACCKVLEELRDAQPPTQAVYQASLAAAERLGMTPEDVAACVVRPPDMGPQLVAGVGLAMAEALCLESHVKAKQPNVDAWAHSKFHQIDKDLRNIMGQAASTKNMRVEAWAVLELAQLLITVGLELVHGGQQECMRRQVVTLCDAIVNHELPSVRTKFGDAAAKLKRRAEGLTTEELRSVILAIGFLDRGLTGRGHWQTCRNGHTYVITECGGPMQLASCPDCGAPIGGTSHQHVEGTSEATDLLRRAGLQSEPR